MEKQENVAVALRQSTADLAEKFIKSGLLPPNVRTPEQAVVLIQMGHELGIQPLQAVNQIYLINGRMMLSSQLSRALVFSRYPNCIFRPTVMTPEKCVIFASRDKSIEPVPFEYTIEQAKAQGLLSKPGSNWVKAPTDMLIARCSARVTKVLFPECLAGIDGFHEGGEVVEADIVISDGDDQKKQQVYLQSVADRQWLRRECLEKGINDTEVMKEINEKSKDKTYEEVSEEINRRTQKDNPSTSVREGTGGSATEIKSALP